VVALLACLALLVAVASLVVAVLALRARPAHRPVGSTDDLPLDVDGLRGEVAALRAELATSVRHVAVVRYDAFGDVGGHLSWSAALVDDAGDGVVLTAIQGRSQARSYVRTVTAWSAEQLSEEETRALADARP